MKLNAQQRFERLNLYGLVQGLSYVVRLNDLKTAQYLRARLALVLSIQAVWQNLCTPNSKSYSRSAACGCVTSATVTRPGATSKE